MKLSPSRSGLGRQIVAAWIAVAALCGLAWSGIARGEPADEPDGPRLVLPGDHEVRAGQWVALRWARADEISELEILLSTDGGRSYSECISPQLDPNRCEFVWRVPPLSSGSLRMRIRFNRRGREIEGAPSRSLRVVAGTKEEPEPLALPPLADAGEKAPTAPRSREESASGRGSLGALDDAAGLEGPREAASESSPTTAQASVRSISHLSVRASSSAPRFIPLRA
jgi:hypothetical protein